MSQYQLWLSKIRAEGSKLTKLSLIVSEEMSLELVIDLITKAIETTGNLQELELQGIVFNKEITQLVAVLIKRNIKLKTINFSTCQIGDANFPEIANSFICGYRSNIENLVLSDIQITKDSLDYFEEIFNFSQLKNLVLDSNPIGREGIIKLMAILANTPAYGILESLSLRGIFQGEQGADIIVEALIKEEVQKFNKLILKLDKIIFEEKAMLAILARRPAQNKLIEWLKDEAKEYFIIKANEAISRNAYLQAEEYFKIILVLDPKDTQAAIGIDIVRVCELETQFKVWQKNNQLFIRRADEASVQGDSLQNTHKNEAELIRNKLCFEYKVLLGYWQTHLESATEKTEAEFSQLDKHLRTLTEKLQIMIYAMFMPSEEPELFPLIQAIKIKDIDGMEKFILQHGIDPNISDLTGRTALHYAAQTNHKELIKLLVAMGARSHIQDKMGKYPCDYVYYKNKNIELIGYLRELHYKYATNYEPKPTKFLAKLVRGSSLAINDLKIIRSKLEEIHLKQQLLKQVYEQACQNNPSMQQELTKLYNQYKSAYDPIINDYTNSKLPSCYHEDIGTLCSEEDRLTRELKFVGSQNNNNNNNARKHLLAFYYELIKFIVDLKILKEFDSKTFRAIHKYYIELYPARKSWRLSFFCQRKEALQKDIISIQPYLDNAINKDDCFFEAVVQALNQLKLTSTEIITLKSLRLLCDGYAKDLQYTWVKKSLLRNGHDYEQYLARIQFTAEEMKKYDQKRLLIGTAIRGRPIIEGRMICDHYNVKLHVIEIIEDSVSGHEIIEQLVDANGFHSIEPLAETDYNAPAMIHVVACKDNFVPLNNTSTSKVLQQSITRLIR